MKKLLSLIMVIVMLVGISINFVGCYLGEDGYWYDSDGNKMDFSFDAKCVTTEDGFKYYVDKEIGLCLLEIPDTEEVIIPEYIDDMRVEQLGYNEKVFMNSKGRDHYLDGKHVKELTISHLMTYYAVMFSQLDRLVIYDYLYIAHQLSKKNTTDEETVSYVMGDSDYEYCFLNTKVELRKSETERAYFDIKLKQINIPKFVDVIEEGVFEGIDNLILNVEEKEIPVEWEEGWNSNNNMVLGAEMPMYSVWQKRY